MLHLTPKGMTSPEVAAALFAVCLLLGVACLGGVAWKARSDRAQCILDHSMACPLAAGANHQPPTTVGW